MLLDVRSLSVISRDDAPWLPFVPPTLGLHHVGQNVSQHDVTIDNTITLFLDVAGFTPLTAALEEHGSAGLEELQGLLNSFFGRVDRTIECWGGAVIRYEGDAVVATFERDSRIADAIGAASNILDIADEMAAVETLAGLQSVRAKIGIAPGTLRSLLLHTGDRNAIVVAGEALDAAVDAEHHATPGDLIADPALADQLDAHATQEVTGTGADVHLLVHPARLIQPPDGRTVPSHADILVDPRLVLDDVVLERLSRGLATTDFRVVGTLFIGLDRIDRLEALQPAVATMSAIVQESGGAVLSVASGDKGHKALISVGAPTAVDDIEARALTIADALLSEPSLHLRIGITTAVNLAGRLGGSVRADYTLLGNGVNMAARLMALAETGSALVDEATAAVVSDSFALSDPMDLDVKGRVTPLRVRSFSTTDGPRPRPISRASSAFVSRTAELTKLETCWELAQAGTGQVGAISGAAGIGKSRLVQHFIEESSAPAFSLSLPRHRRSLGISTLSPLFRWSLGLAEEEAPTGVAVERLLELTGWDPARERYLRVLLDLDPPSAESTPSQNDTELLRSMGVELVRRRASEEPIIIVVDGTSSLAGLARSIVEDIATAIGSLPLFLIVIGREEWWAPADVAMRIDGLSVPDAIRMATALGDPSPSELITGVGGNPLAIELAVGTDARDLRLTALINARIESAGESVANWVRKAAVFGEFVPSNAVTEAVGPLPGEVLSLGLMRPDVTGDWIRFDSDLVREVAYESLTGSNRQALHHLAGSVLEDRLALDDAVTPTMIADHFSHTDDTNRQRTSFRRAGDFAAAAFDLEDAVLWYELLLPLLEQQEQPAVASSLGTWLTTLGEWDRAETWFERALMAGDPTDPQALAGIAGIKQQQGRHREALQLLDRAEIKARGTDPHALAEILIRRADVTWGDRTPAELDEVIAEMIALAPQVGDDLLTRAEHGAAVIQLRLHQNSAGAQVLLRSAIARAEKSGNRVLLCELHNDLAVSYYGEDRLDDALLALTASREHAAAVGYRRAEAAVLANEAALLIRFGAARQGLALCHRATELQVDIGETRFALQHLNLAATVYAALGEDAVALALLEQLKDLVVGQYEGIAEMYIRHHLARSLYRHGILDRAHSELVAVNELAVHVGTEALAEDQAALEVRIAAESDPEEARRILDQRFARPTAVSLYERWRLDPANETEVREVLSTAFAKTPTARLARRLRTLGPAGPANPRTDPTQDLVSPEVFLKLAQRIRDSVAQVSVHQRA